MTAKPDRSAFLPARIRILLVSALLLFGSGIFSGCEKTDDPGPVIGAVRRNGKVSHIRFGYQKIEEDRFKYFALDFYRPKGIYPYGAITFYNLPFEVGLYPVEPRILDTLAHTYILDSVFCADYYTINVDAIWNFFRLIPDHPVNELRITEVDKTKGRIRGTFNLAFERDPYMASLLPDPTHPDTVLFTEGSFKFNYRQ